MKGKRRYVDLVEVGCVCCDWTGWRAKDADKLDKPCPARRRDGSVCGGRVGWL